MTCAVLSCDKPRASSRKQYCAMHEARLRRHGTLERVKPNFSRHSHGYIVVVVPDNHPLFGSQKTGKVYEHRKVFYEAYGYGPFACHWCSVEVHWESMHIDHVNGIKDDNRLCNLVAACRRCNITRDRINTTHCQNGHELTDDNVYLRPNGRRECRTCRSKAFRKWSLDYRVKNPERLAPEHRSCIDVS